MSQRLLITHNAYEQHRWDAVITPYDNEDAIKRILLYDWFKITGRKLR